LVGLKIDSDARNRSLGAVWDLKINSSGWHGVPGALPFVYINVQRQPRGIMAESINPIAAIAIPIGSMYAIYGNIYHQYTPNVRIYTIHGSYGIGPMP
jgi:hypothetical protein